MTALLVLVHSPLVGPETWQAVAEILRARGREAICPDLTGSLAGGPPYWSRQVEAISQGRPSRPHVLIGHSGAGSILPAAGRAVGDVAGYIFVDAGLPEPGRNWFEVVPPELAEHVRTMARDGWLPPWPDWWPPGSLDELLPDREVRTAFVKGCRRLPVALFEEAQPTVPAWPEAPCGYLRLSGAYEVAAAEARRLGWPVLAVESHHLAMLTDPRRVVVALEDLLLRLHV